MHTHTIHTYIKHTHKHIETHYLFHKHLLIFNKKLIGCLRGVTIPLVNVVIGIEMIVSHFAISNLGTSLIRVRILTKMLWLIIVWWQARRCVEYFHLEVILLSKNLFNSRSNQVNSRNYPQQNLLKEKMEKQCHLW